MGDIDVAKHLYEGTLPKDEERLAVATDDYKKVIQLEGAAEGFQPMGDPVYIVPNLSIGPGRITMFAGYGSAGKTIAAQNLALSVATGGRVWPDPTNIVGAGCAKKTKVIHLDRDQGRDHTWRKYQRLAKGMKIDPAALHGWLYVATPHELSLSNDPGGPWAKHIEALVNAHSHEGLGPLVIIDAYVGFLLGGIEENSTEAAKPLYTLGGISQRTKATFIVIHHSRKSSKDDSSAMRSIRGSSAIFGALDSAFVLDADREEYGAGGSLVIHAKSPAFVQDDKFGLRITHEGDRHQGALFCSHMTVKELKKGAEKKPPSGEAVIQSAKGKSADTRTYDVDE